VISIVSHDLRSPLNRLFVLIQLLQLENNNLSAPQKDYVEKMHLVIADSIAMMRNLVDYRNLEYRVIETHMEPVNISEFIKATVRNFSAIAEKKRIQLTEKSASGVITQTDKQCLHRVLDNLISNALKFSSSSKKVEVRLSTTPENVVIEIEDEARGFLKADEEKFFQKFQKLTARPTAGESSTGLGLYIAKSMVEKIGGNITYKTTEGIGSIFSVTLPLLK
jgi:signal transduction histidine kinase